MYSLASHGLYGILSEKSAIITLCVIRSVFAPWYNKLSPFPIAPFIAIFYSNKKINLVYEHIY